jgi:hypothetical protein
VNIFLIGWSATGRPDLNRASTAVRGLVDELAPLDSEAIETWQAPSGHLATVTASHPPEKVHVSYTHFEASRMALFAGRPIHWTPTGQADGRGPLDPRFYLAPPKEWTGTLDGRCTAVRYDEAEGSLDVYTDPLGAYAVYSAQADGTCWLSNKPATLAHLLGKRGLNALALASFFTCSWAVGAATLWEGIEPLARGSLHQFRPDGTRGVNQLLPTQTIGSYFGAGSDPPESARILIETLRAASDWPGRSLRVPLSGGRDSRLVFAAAVAAGLDFEATTIAFPNTPGYPDTSDVVIARRLAEASGQTHSIAPPTQGLGVRRSARLLRLLTNGLVSIGTTGLLTPPQDGVSLPLIHSGQGGEVARAYYGIGDGSAEKLANSIYRHIVPPLPRPIVTSDAEQMVRDFVLDWVKEHLDGGIAPADIPDTFYLLEKMSNMFGPSQSAYEWSSDVISPLWTSRLLRHELALPATERERELFHLQVLEAVAPELARIPFEGVNPQWPGFRSQGSTRMQRYQILASKIAHELRRRARAHRSRDAGAVDPLLAETLREARDCMLALPSHPAWDVLHRKRVRRLLSRTPANVDPRSRRYLLGLATVFAAEDDAAARAD